MKIKIQKTNKKNLLAFSILAILLLSGGALAYSQQKTKDKDVVRTTPSKTASEITILPNTENPLSNEERQAADKNAGLTKEDFIAREQQMQNQNPPSGQVSVKPIVTYAGTYGSQVEAGAYISNIFEDGGVCTATFTNGSKMLTKDVSAIKNVNSTDCPAMVINSSEFIPKGTWSVIITYSSPTASGSSDSKDIEVK